MIDNCSNCVGERANLCRSFFYEAAVNLVDSAGAVESLLELGDSKTAMDFHEDQGARVVPRLIERLDIIGCALNSEEAQIKVQERIDNL